MKFQMAKNSLFAILLRSPWWISFAVAGGTFAAARFLLPVELAAFSAVPFVVIGLYAGWRQLRAPSAATVGKRVAAVRAMAWEEFAPTLEAAYRRDGYTVNRLAAEDADLEIVKAGRVALVSGKRWKAGRTGIEPLQKLQAARRKRDAQEAMYIATGEITDNARVFATQNNIKLVEGRELATLIPKGFASNA
jgi:restriction system protein